MWNCLVFIEEGALLQTNARNMEHRRGHIIIGLTSSASPSSATPSFPVKALINPGVVQRVIKDNCHWKN